MKFMKLSCIVLSLTFLTSCSGLLKKSAVHDKMATQLQTDYYPYTVQELETKLSQHLENTKVFGNKLIILSDPGAASNTERQQKIKEEMEEGFTYKDQLYTSKVDFDFSMLTTDTNKIKNKILKAKYHVLEKSDNSFLIVKGDNIYEAKTAEKDPKKSSLRIYKLTNVYRPLSFNVDWWKLIKGKGLFVGAASAPIDLISSRQYQKADRMEELAVFFAIDEARANKLEEEISATL